MESIIRTTNILDNFSSVGTESSKPLLDQFKNKKNETKKIKSIYYKCLFLAFLTNIFQYLLSPSLQTHPVELNKKPSISNKSIPIPKSFSSLTVKLDMDLIPDFKNNLKIKIANSKNLKIITEGILIEKLETRAKIAIPTLKINEIAHQRNGHLIALPYKYQSIKREPLYEIKI